MRTSRKRMRPSRMELGTLVKPPDAVLAWQRFGRLNVQHDWMKRSQTYFWKYRCECGTTGWQKATDLISGKKTHCGCMNETRKSNKGMKYNRYIGSSWCDRSRRAALNQNIRASKLGIEGTLTFEDLVEKLGHQKGLCAICHAILDETRHLDHIRPLSRGGTNWPFNVQWTCAACNLSKNATWADPAVERRNIDAAEAT